MILVATIMHNFLSFAAESGAWGPPASGPVTEETHSAPGVGILRSWTETLPLARSKAGESFWGKASSSGEFSIVVKFADQLGVWTSTKEELMRAIGAPP